MPPAQVLDSVTPYRGRIFDIQVDTVRLPHGRVANMELVMHRPSVVLVPMPSPHEIILVRQYRHAAGRELWELPAGNIEPGEDPQACAVRECHEEVGLVPRIVEPLTTLWPSPGFCTEQMHFFRCADLVEPDETAAQDEDEDVRPRRFTLEEARAMVAAREIVDMRTVLGILVFAAMPWPPQPGAGDK